MTRLYYIDILRGIAVLLMVSFQTANALKLLDLYGNPILFHFGELSWVFIFWFASGFSVMLMRQKYTNQHFWRKLILRFVEFSIIGYFLIWFVPFNIPNPYFYEALGSIALNSLILGAIIYFKRIEICISCLAVCLALYQVIPLNIYFNPFEVLSFMLLGSILALNPPKTQIRFRILEFFGRHALIFYVGHFIIIGLINKMCGVF